MAKSTQSARAYTAQDIQVLEGLEAVRKRPGMYVGGTDIKALHHTIFEVVDNSVDEAMAGECDRIEIVIHPDNSVSVEDNGRGIPVEKHQTGRSALEVVMTKLHAGAKFGGGGYKVSGGLHGVGVSAVNALSEWCVVEVKRGGKLYRQNYKRGVPQGPVERAGGASGTGTRTTFMPDSTIFESIDFRFDSLLQRFREMAFLTRGLTIYARDERSDPMREMTFYFQDGVTSFVRYLNRGHAVLHEPVSIVREVNGILVEAAWQFTESFTDNTFSFANTIVTPDGGVHLTGFRAAITGTLNDYARKAGLIKENDANFSGDDTRDGITAIIGVKVPDPQFESQTKVKLLNAEVRLYVQSAVSEAFTQWLEENPREGRAIVDKALTAARARAAARQARDLVIRKSALESSSLPGKLADCTSRGNEDSELYIVEGNSAGGTAKQGRDRQFQAVLPLRGKILNVEKARLDKILANVEIRSLIQALGCGVGEDVDVANLRYARVIIMTDAGVDGSHIRTLLLTFFFRYMAQIVEGGKLFIAQPPLYLIVNRKQRIYAYSDAEKDKALKGLKGDGHNVQRYKGLGEMNPEQLWETTMDPNVRTILKVTIEDAAAASRTFDMLMGAEVPPRARFIRTHARDANLDV